MLIKIKGGREWNLGDGKSQIEYLVCLVHMAQIKNSTIYKNLYLLPSKHTRTHKRSLNGQCYTQYFRYLKNYQIYIWCYIQYPTISHYAIYDTQHFHGFSGFYFIHFFFSSTLVFPSSFLVLDFLLFSYSCVCVCHFSQSLTRRLKREIDFPQSHNVIFIFISSVSMSFAFSFAFFFIILFSVVRERRGALNKFVVFAVVGGGLLFCKKGRREIDGQFVQSGDDQLVMWLVGIAIIKIEKQKRSKYIIQIIKEKKQAKQNNNIIHRVYVVSECEREKHVMLYCCCYSLLAAFCPRIKNPETFPNSKRQIKNLTPRLLCFIFWIFHYFAFLCAKFSKNKK